MAREAVVQGPFEHPTEEVMTPEDVQLIARRWDIQGEIAKELGSTPTADAEALIHELAHAAVFRLPPDPQVIQERVNARFLRYRSKHASDRAECAALAVEKIVFETLGWEIDFARVVDLAHADFRSMMFLGEARDLIESMCDERAAERAGQVIAWLWALTGKGPS